jgi:hypothetical protein
MDAVGRPRLDLVLRDMDLSAEANLGALDACAVHLITGALILDESPLISEGVITLLGEFGDCMRTRGVPDFPMVVGGFNGIGSPFPIEEIPYDDPDLATASQTCREELAAD